MGTSTSRVKLQGEETVSTAAERASRSIRQMKADIERGTGPVRELGKLANSLFALGGATAAIAMFKRVAGAVGECIDEYQKHEQAVARLTTGFRNGNTDISMTVGGLVDLADQLQRTTLFTHDASESAIGLMRSIGGLGEGQIRPLLPLLQDFATAIGVNLEEAAKMAAQSIEGTRNSLGRWGIELDKSMSTSEKAAAIADQLREKFGGMAVAVGDNATGSIIKLRNAMSDLKEEQGRAAANFFKPLNDAYRKLIENATDALKAHNDLMEALGRQAKGTETTKDRIVLYTNKIKELQEQLAMLSGQQAAGAGQWMTLMQNVNPETAVKDIQAQIQAYGRAISALQQKAAADKDAADEATLARQAELSFLDKLEDAYGRTKEGKLAALRAEITYWETTRAKYREHAAEIRAILLPLYEELAKATAGPQISARNFYGMEQRVATPLQWTSPPIGSRNLYGMEQRSLEPLTQASINLANQFGLLERQTGETGGALKELAIERYREGLGAWREPAETFARTEVGAAAIGPKLGMDIGPLGDLFGSILPMFAQFAGILGSVNMILNPIATILTGVFQVLAPIIDVALKPIIGILILLGNTVGKMLTPIFAILGPIIKAVATVFIWLYNNVIRHIGNAIITAANIIYDIIAFFYNAVATVINFLLGWLGVHLALMEYRGLTEGHLEKISMEDITAAAETTQSYGGGAGGGAGSSTTIQRVPDIYVTINVQGSVYGPGGLRQIGQELAEALKEFAGIGGRIHIEEAIAPVKG